EVGSAEQGSVWFAAPQFVGFLCFFIAGIAETNRAPFDLPEAEQELVAGYHTEYSGMRWGLFQMAEYINMLTLSALTVTLFLGGWHFFWLDWLRPPLVLLKLALLLFVFILAGGAFPPHPLRPADGVRLEGPAAGRDRERRDHRSAGGGAVSPQPISTIRGFGVTFTQIF